MICKKPFRKGVMEYGCGQCMPCRINKQRTWVGRLSLEVCKAQASCFVTLTYDDDHLPPGGELNKRDVQLWMKRLRKRYPLSLRFFLVGEYGEQRGRPHYHAILFGVPSVASSLISQAWGKGGVHVGTVGPGTLSYVSGYVTKKMTKKTDPRLEGRPPEFTLMSRGGRKTGPAGIGYPAVNDLVAAYRSPQGKQHLEETQWITNSVRISGKIYPMGRYLTEKIIGHLALTPEQRKMHQYRVMRQKFDEKSTLTTTEYEKRRKARVEQQEGQVVFQRASWKRTL